MLQLIMNVLYERKIVNSIFNRSRIKQAFELAGSGLLLMSLAISAAWADSLQLKNGSLIKGKFVGGTESEVTFKVDSSVQNYNVADIVAIRFDSGAPSLDARPDARPDASSFSDVKGTGSTANTSGELTIPVGTQISVRTIDAIDSAKNRVGDRFQASLQEPITVNGQVVVEKGADVYGRLAESKTSGTFTGRSELQLELTGMVVNGKTVPLVTGEYELTGKSRGASTAKRTAGGAALGAIIGAIADGGKGAAIGAGVGGGVGAGSEIITKGDLVKVPSETLINFTLQQEVSIPVRLG